MCGIFALLKDHIDDKLLKNLNREFKKGKNRGPENSHFEKINTQLVLGFHRLAINGYQLDSSEQPIKLKDCILICNGEIYNWKQLHDGLSIDSTTQSDCEIIIHLYRKFGIKAALTMLDGVFSFVLFDKLNTKLFIARDPYGIRPLFMAKSKNDNICVASELKMMSKLNLWNDYKIKQFTPGTFMYFNENSSGQIRYHTNSYVDTGAIANTEELALTSIRHSLIKAVEKRIDNTDRDIACLLSGGLDSSLITGIVSQLVGSQKLHTWSIGMKGSEDLKYAAKVAKFLDTNHHSIELEPKEFIDAIETVIKTIESYDTTTVRASVGNWLICKYIREQSDAKVIFNGDGSDEVTGGYMYFHCAPDDYEFDAECRRLLRDIHYFDVLRSDRSISSHGLEARTPFLDKTFVQNYLSIPARLRNHANNNQPEKYLLRKAFDKLNIIPQEVLWRTKEAFSDGVSTQKEAWFETIQNYALDYYKKSSIELGIECKEMTGAEAEKNLYKAIFNKYYSGHEDIIPYFWMPKFVDATDASARTLDVYKSKQTNSAISSENIKLININ
jgi:asparagine synthase (glutamine-hydrolysing)